MHYRFVLLLALLLAPSFTTALIAAEAVDESVLKAESARVAVIAKACQSGVSIFADGGTNGGSGVIISPDGYVLTNFHVVKPAGNWMKCGLSDGKLYDAVLVGFDPVGDVALIKLLGRDDFPAVTMADSDLVQVGDWAFCVGNPFLLADDFQPTVTYGIVSGVHRYQYPAGTLLEYADCIQTDASINPGNSGGPLFNARGELIGINGRGSFEKRGRVNVGVGYAISINQIKHFLGHLKGGRIVDHATLGATVATNDDGKVLVSDILNDSDASRRGLRYNDEIVQFAGRPIRTVNAFKNVLGIFPRDWQVPLTFRRGGQTHEIWVRLAGVHGVEELIAKAVGRPQTKRPEPKPGDPLPDGHPQPDKAPGEKPPKIEPGKMPIPLPLKAEKKARPVPPEVQKLLEARHGFANYHFNKLNRTRVWQALNSRGDYQTTTEMWTLRGEVAPAGEAVFEIAEQSVQTSLPGGRLKLDVGPALTDAVEPRGSGGLLAALHAWRRLLVLGPDKFGDLTYLGVLPLRERGGATVDVLRGVYAGVVVHFYVDAPAGELVKVALFLNDDDDPCELLWSDYREVEGRRLPHRLEVHYGDQIYGVYQFKQVQLTARKDV